MTGFVLVAKGADIQYQPTWESVTQRPVAQRWRDAKTRGAPALDARLRACLGTHSSFTDRLPESREEEARDPKPRRNVLNDEHRVL